MKERVVMSLKSYNNLNNTWEMNPQKITVENAKKICFIPKCKFEEVNEWK